MPLSSCLIKRLLLMLLAVAGWSSFLVGGEEKPTDTPKTQSIPVVLFPSRQAILSAEISARVIRVHRKMGEEFKKGDPLIDLDDAAFRARMDMAKVNLESTEIELESVRKLYASKSRSRVELAQAERAAAQARAEYVIASKQVASCHIVAPFDGRIDTVAIHEHELVQGGQPLVSIYNDRKILARFFLPESRFRDVKIGQYAVFRFDGFKVPVQGEVTRINRKSDAASGLYEIHVEIDNAKQTLNSGRTGTLEALRAPPNASESQ